MIDSIPFLQRTRLTVGAVRQPEVNTVVDNPCSSIGCIAGRTAAQGAKGTESIDSHLNLQDGADYSTIGSRVKINSEGLC